MRSKNLWRKKWLYIVGLHKKRRQFQKLGYNNVSTDDLWNYIVQHQWKKGFPLTYKEKMKQISGIQINDYFDYQQIEAQISGSQSFDWQNLEDLF